MDYLYRVNQEERQQKNQRRSNARHSQTGFPQGGDEAADKRFLAESTARIKRNLPSRERRVCSTDRSLRSLASCHLARLKSISATLSQTFNFFKMNPTSLNQIRPRKIGYQARSDWRTCRTKFFPSLLLAGNWFAEAGFNVGQSVTVEVQSGIITIRPATN